MKKILITGGTGFIGTNLATRLLTEGKTVYIVDNLSRAGTKKNLACLKSLFPDKLFFRNADITKRISISDLIEKVDMVFHFAAQVAVTTSFESPRHDFDVNLIGTINLLEAIRNSINKPSMIFTSTNKVYGNLDKFEYEENDTRYSPVTTASKRVRESQSLDLNCPYGCSKGAADQYIITYARSYGIHAVVFRMSCIYGPHQYGNEDQGWIAHFLINAMKNSEIKIFGTGKQVRDALYIDDLVNAFLLAATKIEKFSGEAFNIGGGMENTTSLLELLNFMKYTLKLTPNIRFLGWREGDQKYYVSDTRKFENATGWKPKTKIEEGLALLHHWLENEFFPHSKILKPAEENYAAISKLQ